MCLGFVSTWIEVLCPNGLRFCVHRIRFVDTELGNCVHNMCPLCPHGFVGCVHMMNILKEDPMRKVSSVLADILWVDLV